MRRVITFHDASALIYLIEGAEPFATGLRKKPTAVVKRHPDIGGAISRLSWLERRVGPMKSQDSAILARYDAILERTDLVWVELTQRVVELAAAILVQTGLKTPDALQAASCLQLGCEHWFLTGESAFRRFSGLNGKVLGVSDRRTPRTAERVAAASSCRPGKAVPRKPGRR